MKGIVKLGVTLFVVCAIAAGSLAFFADLTAEPIAAQVAVEQRDALKRVAPLATEFTEAEKGRRWDALGSGASVGRVLAVQAKGYGGPIGIMVGMGNDGKITGVRILTQTETPGLGNKIATEGFLGQFVGKTPEQLWLKKDRSAGAIDAIAAATISSRAVTNALRTATEGQ
jgi:Na+-translocating ferredoxin:NAD+ oxidoreductase subunit G